MIRSLAALAALAVLLLAAPPDYRQALPGYHFEFPRDHFNHPDFRTEWWYYESPSRSALIVREIKKARFQTAIDI